MDNTSNAYKVSGVVGYYLTRALENAPWGNGAVWNKLTEDLDDFRFEYVPGLAQSVRNYMVLIAAGEMRHATESNCRTGFAKARHIEDFPSTGSYLPHYNKVIGGGYDMKALTDSLAAVFGEGYWDSSYGGKRWAEVARHAGKLSDETIDRAGGTIQEDYKQVCLWLEVAVGIVHNGGSLFNKGEVDNAYLIRDWDTDQIKKFLDWKFNIPNLLTAITGTGHWNKAHGRAQRLLRRWYAASELTFPAVSIGPSAMPVARSITWGSAKPVISYIKEQPVVSIPAAAKKAEAPKVVIGSEPATSKAWEAALGAAPPETPNPMYGPFEAKKKSKLLDPVTAKVVIGQKPPSKGMVAPYSYTGDDLADSIATLVGMPKKNGEASTLPQHVVTFLKDQAVYDMTMAWANAGPHPTKGG